MNTSTTFWGPDAREFKPERWLEEDALCNLRAKEIQGHRHILTFSDGPRTCLGKTFALTEFKVSIETLVFFSFLSFWHILIRPSRLS